ncbi:MAG: hydroxyacid dehydrogenase, partial [Planctomycetes bacterium]|nr:hydroxyacid dehydrogenase [Planctomycetota bacterium]
AKHIVASTDRTRRGEFSFRGLRGLELSGKTLGIVGTGKIGLNVARMARGFNMRVIGYDRYPNEQGAELGITYLPYEQLLGKADVITFHVPESPDTFHMLNQGNIDLLKRHCLVINTARGSVIETRALVRALSEDKIGGAGLDVLEEEPVVREERELVSSLFHQAHDLSAILSGQILLRFNNVIITPHNAFNTTEAVHRTLETTVDNIQSFLKG